MKPNKILLYLLLTVSTITLSFAQSTTVITNSDESTQEVSQTETSEKESKTKSSSSFMESVRFGGAVYFSYGSSDHFNIGVAPTALYEFNKFFSAGASITYMYSNYKYELFSGQKINYSSHNYGGSLIALINPINKIQLSAEYEQLRVNFVEKQYEDYWVPALYLGAAYRIRNVSVGIRYDALYDNAKSIYGSEWSPFVRIYF